MIDSHSHLYSSEFDADRDAVMQRAAAAGVRHVVLPGENAVCVPAMTAMCERYAGRVSMAIGLHPEEVRDNCRDELHRLHKLLTTLPHVVGVGEIGIDLYWDKTYREQQLEVLHEQLCWCVELNLPFIMHCREGLDECLWVLDNLGHPAPRGVFHSFTGTPAEVELVRRRGDFYFGVNGIVTFKKSTVHELLPVVGLDRLLLETDSPYLAPVPHRGKRNESAFVADVAACVAAHMSLPVQDIETATERNAIELFGLNLE